MNNFKRACSRAGVTGSTKASLEECIDGLKQLIRTDDDEDGLEVIDFLELIVILFNFLLKQYHSIYVHAMLNTPRLV